MKYYRQSLHIISVQMLEFLLTIASKSVDGKSNEITAIQNVDTIHWLLDVCFEEDCLRVSNQTIQENINFL